jgi:Ca2+-transporting ATPase
LYLDKTELEARTLSFATLIISNLILILSNLSWEEPIFSKSKLENKALIYVTLGAVIFLLLTIYLPYLREIFLFHSLDLKEWGIVFSAGVFVLAGLEIFKRFIIVK